MNVIFSFYILDSWDLIGPFGIFWIRNSPRRMFKEPQALFKRFDGGGNLLSKEKGRWLIGYFSRGEITWCLLCFVNSTAVKFLVRT